MAKQLPLQETPLCRTSSFYPAIGAVSLPAQAVVGRVALVLPGLQLSPARSWESWWKAAVSSSLFQLLSEQGQKSGPERRHDSCGLSSWLFRFRPVGSLFDPTDSLFPLMNSVVQLTLPRVHPALLSVEQAVVQSLTLSFGKSKSSAKR